MSLRAYIDDILAASVLTEEEKENYRAAIGEELVLLSLEVVAIERGAEEWPSYGGTDGESDCPLELGSPSAGSRHRRPEGYTVGARWLQDWRLP